MLSFRRSATSITSLSRRFLSSTSRPGKQPTKKPQRRRRPIQQNHDATFGMKPVDYSIQPPIMPSPLAPPPRPGKKAAIVRSIWPITLALTAALGLFIYWNEEDDNKDFWQTIETGGAILPDDEDDDDEFLELLEEEEEEL